MMDMMDIVLRIMNIIERVRTASSISEAATIGFAVLLVFGFVNCILGYRLLRFWMMLFGFVIGAGIGFGAAFSMGYREKVTFIGAAVGVGVVLAALAFMSYKVGIFILGAGLGLSVGVYILHPTSSLTFFLCLLLGAILGSLAMKWAREVIIVGTSLLGGAMAGVSAAKLGGLADIPYGILLSIAFALLGMLIQFATNRRRDAVDDDDEWEEEDRPVKTVKKTRRRTPQPRKVYPADDFAPEYEKTVEFRPRRKSQELDLPLGSFSGGEKYDEIYDEMYDEEYNEPPIDEELLDEEILKEMMEEEDRKSELLWEKISGKKSSRKKKNGKRSKN